MESPLYHLWLHHPWRQSLSHWRQLNHCLYGLSLEGPGLETETSTRHDFCCHDHHCSLLSSWIEKMRPLCFASNACLSWHCKNRMKRTILEKQWQESVKGFLGWTLSSSLVVCWERLLFSVASYPGTDGVYIGHISCKHCTMHTYEIYWYAYTLMFHSPVFQFFAYLLRNDS